MCGQPPDFALEKREFSTLSTDLSTEAIHSLPCISTQLLVYIRLFDKARLFSHFFPIKHIDESVILSHKKGLDKLSEKIFFENTGNF